VSRLPDDYFDSMYSQSADPWDLATRWYERRKYAITLALLPQPTYRHAFEPGCSVGVLTALLSERCDHVTATDVAPTALRGAQRRLDDLGRHDRVTLLRRSIDEPWPKGPFDLLVLSEVGYYLTPGRGLLHGRRSGQRRGRRNSRIPSDRQLPRRGRGD
jgi:protein-L-isoaspartate O-methyltransferase